VITALSARALVKCRSAFLVQRYRVGDDEDDAADLADFDAIAVAPLPDVMEAGRQAAQSGRQFGALGVVAGDEALHQPAGAEPLAQRQRLGIRAHLVALQGTIGRAVEAALAFVLFEQAFHLVGNDLVDQLRFLLAVELVDGDGMDQHQHQAGQCEASTRT
jgi:hypothetical protein